MPRCGRTVAAIVGALAPVVCALVLVDELPAETSRVLADAPVAVRSQDGDWPTELEALLKELRYDRWGRPETRGAHERLLKMRFVTSQLCHELEWPAAAPNSNANFARLIMVTLGTIKDPSSIPALRRYWEQHNHYGLMNWLYVWYFTGYEYFPTHPAEWDVVKEAWSSEFRHLLRQDHDEQVTLGLVETAVSWFHDDAMTAALVRNRDRWENPEVQLVLEWALRQRIDAWKRRDMTEAVAALARDRVGDLTYYAARYPLEEHAAFLANLEPTEHERDAHDRALRGITFARPAGTWSEWWTAHGHESRTAWFETRRAAIKALPDGEQLAALRQFLTQDCRPGDRLLLPMLVELADTPELWREVVVLLRPSLDPYVQRLTGEILKKLEPHPEPERRQELLKRLLLIPVSWEESVEWRSRWGPMLWCRASSARPRSFGGIDPHRVVVCSADARWTSRRQSSRAGLPPAIRTQQDDRRAGNNGCG